jgi:hypothetical protein
MNERIEKLARQSGALPTQDCGVPQWYIDEDEFEKFAELLIRECADRIVNTLLADLEGPDPDDVLWLAAKQVKQHFGVEE